MGALKVTLATWGNPFVLKSRVFIMLVIISSCLGDDEGMIGADTLGPNHGRPRPDLKETRQ